MEQVNLERSQLTSVPTALLEMRTGRVSLAGNRIRETPAAFFSNHDYYRSLLLSENPLQALPTEDVENFNAHELGLRGRIGTNISTLPPWVEEAAAQSMTRALFVLAAGTPFCSRASDTRPTYVQRTPPELQALTFHIEIDKLTLANPP